MLKVTATREGAYWNYTGGRPLVQLRNLNQVRLQTFLLLKHEQQNLFLDQSYPETVQGGTALDMLELRTSTIHRKYS